MGGNVNQELSLASPPEAEVPGSHADNPPAAIWRAPGPHATGITSQQLQTLFCLGSWFVSRLTCNFNFFPIAMFNLC